MPHDPSIIQLYYTVEALKQDHNSIILQFMAALPGEGTSTIARAFAAVAASAGAKGVLLVDAAPVLPGPDMPGRKPTLIDAYKQGKPRGDAITSSPRAQNLQAARLSSQPNPMIEIDSGDMTQLFSELRQEFSLIIFDSGAATQTPDAIALSRYCDGTILVVRAAYSSPAVIAGVQKNIQLVGGEIIGVVLNRHKNYIPAWVDQALFPGGAERRGVG